MAEKVVQLNIRITESMMAQIEAFQALKKYSNKRDAVEDLLRAGLAISSEDMYFGQVAKYVNSIITTRLHSEMGVLAGRLDEMEEKILAATDTACALGVGGIAATVSESNKSLPAGVVPSDPGAVFKQSYKAGIKALSTDLSDLTSLREIQDDAVLEWEDDGEDW